MAPNIETEGLLKEVYRDGRKILVTVLGIAFYIPKEVYKKAKRKRDLRQHRSNYENADVEGIWSKAKPSIKRRLTNDERFLYRTATHPATAIGYGLVMTNAQEKIDMSAYIIQALDEAKPSKSIEATGEFVLHIEMAISVIDPNYFEVFRRIVVDEVSRVFNSQFELDLAAR